MFSPRKIIRNLEPLNYNNLRNAGVFSLRILNVFKTKHVLKKKQYFDWPGTSNSPLKLSPKFKVIQEENLKEFVSSLHRRKLHCSGATFRVQCDRAVSYGSIALSKNFGMNTAKVKTEDQNPSQMEIHIAFIGATNGREQLCSRTNSIVLLEHIGFKSQHLEPK